MAWEATKVTVAAGLGLLILGAGAYLVTRRSIVTAPPPPAIMPPPAMQPAKVSALAKVKAKAEVEGPRAPDEDAYKTEPVADIPADFPIAKGFPLALPGAIIASPVIADIEANGKPVIIVPCVQRDRNNSLVHPSPNERPLLFAIRADGSTVRGWPVALGDSVHLGPRTYWNANGPWGGWNSSPAVIPSEGGDRLALTGATGGATVIVTAKRKLITMDGGPAPGSPVVVDLTGKKGLEMFNGWVHASAVSGEPLAGYFHNGFVPCVGDALGDGHLYLFHLFFTNKGTNLCDVVGVDASGKTLSGWPQLVDDPTWFGPVMGDISGTGKMSIVLGCGRHIHAWTFDGQPVPGCQTVHTDDGDLDSVLIDNVMATNARPALADLDGDGKAEIILFDPNRHALRAWYGDGKPFGKFSDGVIAELDAPAQGVSVVSLGDDPKIIDFFLGTVWVRLKPDGSVTTIHMLPSDETPSVEWMQPTVCDLFGDGKASVLFGTSDGRLVVYNTGLAFHPDRAQWPTAHHDFQHTACWTRSKTQP